MDILWNDLNKGCQLDYSNITAPTSQGELTEVLALKERAENNLLKFLHEPTELSPSLVTEHQHRAQRGVLVALLAAAAAGIFGLGVGFKDTLSCTLERL